MDLEILRGHAAECEAVAKERAETEGGGLHYMNTCDWAYAVAFRTAADEIERLRRHEIRRRDTLSAELQVALSEWRDAGAPVERVVIAIGNLVQFGVDFVIAEFDKAEGSTDSAGKDGV